MKTIILALTLITAQAALASDCFFARSVRGWRYDMATDTLEVRAGATYQVSARFCQGLPWARQIAFRSFGGSWVCQGDEVLVINAWNQVEESCRIDSITRM